MSHPPQTRGNMVEEDQLSQLVPGTSTRQDVTSLLGSPTAVASFNDNSWIYIGTVTKPVIGATNEIREQKVVTLTFDSKGTLRGIDRKTEADSVPVEIVARATPSPGTEASFMQQLLGNIGKFTPGATQGSDTAGRGVSGSY